MTEAIIVGLIAAIPTSLAAAAAWHHSRAANKKADAIVQKAAEIHNSTNGAYQAVKCELIEARKEIAALKALWEAE